MLANKGWMFKQRGSKKCRILQVNRVMRSKMYREISKGIFNQKKSLCVLIYWNLIYLFRDGNNIKTLVLDQKCV